MLEGELVTPLDLTRTQPIDPVRLLTPPRHCSPRPPLDCRPRALNAAPRALSQPCTLIYLHSNTTPRRSPTTSDAPPTLAPIRRRT
jgi:hypothetical protein